MRPSGSIAASWCHPFPLVTGFIDPSASIQRERCWHEPPLSKISVSAVSQLGRSKVLGGSRVISWTPDGSMYRAATFSPLAGVLTVNTIRPSAIESTRVPMTESPEASCVERTLGGAVIVEGALTFEDAEGLGRGVGSGLTVP